MQPFIHPQRASTSGAGHTQAHGVGRQFRGAVQVELAHEVLAVLAHRQRADAEVLGDLPRTASLGGQDEDLPLPPGQFHRRQQVGIALRASGRAVQLEAQAARQVVLATAQGSDGLEQFTGVLALAQVAMHTRVEHRTHGSQFRVGRQHQDSQPRMTLAQFMDELQPVETRHVQVEQEQVRTQFFQQGLQVHAIRRLAHHLDTVQSRQQQAQAIADNAVVIGDAHPQFARPFHHSSP